MEFRRSADLDFQMALALRVGGITRGSDQVVVAFRVVAAEKPASRRVEPARIPLTLHDVYFVAPAGEDEIHIASGFVAPKSDRSIWEPGLEMLQYHVFPERAEVIGSQWIPAAHKADETRIDGSRV